MIDFVPHAEGTSGERRGDAVRTQGERRESYCELLRAAETQSLVIAHVTHGTSGSAN